LLAADDGDGDDDYDKEPQCSCIWQGETLFINAVVSIIILVTIVRIKVIFFTIIDVADRILAINVASQALMHTTTLDKRLNKNSWQSSAPLQTKYPPLDKFASWMSLYVCPSG